MNATPIQAAGTLCFILALLHTFSVKRFQHFARRFRSGSAGENFFHLLGEVEVVFGIWAAIFLLFIGIDKGTGEAAAYLRTRNFTEPVFVFAIMAVCSTRPILQSASRLIEAFSKMIPISRPAAFYLSALVIGPILGSFITEPAAMTVTALILMDRFYKGGISSRLKYATLGLLFVNISVGGTLTPYAAPPVLMVAGEWGWGPRFMMWHFGWKALLAIGVSTGFVVFRFREELRKLPGSTPGRTSGRSRIPAWVTLAHLLFLAAIVFFAHELAVFAGISLFFLGLTVITKEHQEELNLRESLLVAFFLGGLVVLGEPQRWWLEPVLTKLEALPLFLGSMSLTAITDNAALTYLGSQVPNLAVASRYALVAGAVAGGGLTVIANAPNPAGYGILNFAFGEEGISPLLLFLNALPPTLVAAACYWFL